MVCTVRCVLLLMEAVEFSDSNSPRCNGTYGRIVNLPLLLPLYYSLKFYFPMTKRLHRIFKISYLILKKLLNKFDKTLYSNLTSFFVYIIYLWCTII